MFELASLVGVSLSRLLVVVPSRSIFVKLHPSNDARRYYFTIRRSVPFSTPTRVRSGVRRRKMNEWMFAPSSPRWIRSRSFSRRSTRVMYAHNARDWMKTCVGTRESASPRKRSLRSVAVRGADSRSSAVPTLEISR